MAIKKRGLGRGLDAIFLDNNVDLNSKGEKPIMIKLSDIEPYRDQPRKDFDQEALESLAQSILEVGLINPIVVRETPSGIYQIIAGERRWRACKLAGLTEAPVIILRADDLKAAEITLMENLQREDLNEIEKANGYKALIEKFGMTQEELSNKIKTSRSAISNSMRILDLPEDVLDMIRNGQISAGHGRTLLGIKDKEKISSAAKIVVEKELSVRDSEKLVKSINDNKPKKKDATPKNAIEVDYVAEVENKLQKSLGRKVKLITKGKNKSLNIEYHDNDDLETLIDMLIKATKNI